VKFFIEDYGQLEDIRDRFVTRIWYAAQRNNLNIPFPIRTLYHFHGPTSLAQGTEKKFAAGLQSIPTNFPLDGDGITLQHFGYGETVVHQGSVNNALYVLISGQAAMRTIDKQGKLQEIHPVVFWGGGFECSRCHYTGRYRNGGLDSVRPFPNGFFLAFPSLLPPMAV
jgi:hypothetical protein